jgi:hypothetical protein
MKWSGTAEMTASERLVRDASLTNHWFSGQ